MSISPDKKRVLIATAHALSPIIIIGHQELSEGIIKETDRALTDHELIKVKINAADKQACEALAATLCEQLSAHLLRVIGKTAIIFRHSNKFNKVHKDKITGKGYIKNKKPSRGFGSKSNSGKGKKKPKIKS